MPADNRRPNVVYISADEWRAQATGYNGDTNCETPTLDALSREGLARMRCRDRRYAVHTGRA